jgi:hypothetical protein
MRIEPDFDFRRTAFEVRTSCSDVRLAFEAVCTVILMNAVFAVFPACGEKYRII